MKHISSTDTIQTDALIYEPIPVTQSELTFRLSDFIKMIAQVTSDPSRNELPVIV